MHIVRTALGLTLGSAVTLAAGSAFPAFAQASCVPPSAGAFATISAREVELLIADVAKTKPESLKAMRADAAKRQAQLENLKQLLAFASQAVKDGTAAEAINCDELRNIRSEVVATVYDREVNRNKPPMPPFGYIGPDKLLVFWGTGDSDPVAKKREAEFQRFLDTKTAMLRVNDPANSGRITDEEKEQAREFFARVQIYANEYERNAATMGASFREKTELQVRLQQAQFLAKRVSDKSAPDTDASEAEIDAYVRSHPEIDPEAKRKRAERVLLLAKGGEDFALLADEYSEDPGNKDSKGKLHGGLYVNVPKGQFLEAFEKAALAFEAGQIAPQLVETDYGFHVIKLERKGDTYDVRHILISTQVPDPDNPSKRPVPVRQYARSMIETDKEARLVARLVRENNVSVPDDLAVPAESTAKPKSQATGKRPVRRRN